MLSSRQATVKPKWRQLLYASVVHRPSPAKVSKMRLPWALGAADEEGFVVIQLVGAVIQAGTRPPGAGCFALLRWGGKVVGQTPSCHEVLEPTWHEQVRAEIVYTMLDECVCSLSLSPSLPRACSHQMDEHKFMVRMHIPPQE